MDKKEQILLSIIILSVGAMIIGLVLGLKNIDKAMVEHDQQVKEQIIDCQSRGNELKWCLDIIK